MPELTLAAPPTLRDALDEPTPVPAPWHRAPASALRAVLEDVEQADAEYALRRVKDAN